MTDLFAKLLKRFEKQIAFFEGDVLYYAASLSFYTLLTVVPLLLVVVSIFSYMPMSEILLSEFMSYIETNLLPMQSQYLSSFIQETLDKRLEIGLFGVLYALFASLFFFYDYDYVVAKMFGARKKSFLKALGIYSLFILLIPIGMAGLMVLTTVLQSGADFAFSFFPLGSRELITLLATWMTFLLVIRVSVSLSMHVKTLLLTSFIIAFSWSLLQKLFLWYVAHNVMYTTIYGSFASIFFFFLWIYASWVLYLYGLKLGKLLHEIKQTGR